MCNQNSKQQGTSAYLDLAGPWGDMKVTDNLGNVLGQNSDGSCRKHS